jgi:hypothetical protein
MAFKSQQTTWRGPWGIVNHLGAPWSTHTFWDAKGGETYLAKQAKEFPMLKLGRHRVVPVSVTVRTVKP